MARIHVTLNRNTFKISENNKKSIRLSKKAINVLKKKRKSILSDIKTGNGDTKSYWKLGKAEILTKKINSSERNSGKSTLFIVENSTTIELDKDSFVDLLREALKLMKNDQCPSFKADEFHTLTNDKKIKINSKDDTFSVLDEKNHVLVTLPLAALEKVMQQKKKIFADMQGEGIYDSERINYWSGGNCCIYTKSFKNFRIICFQPKFSFKSVCIRDYTLQSLLDKLGEFFGEGESSDDDLPADESESYGEKLEINEKKSIEFSTNKRKCIITKKSDRKREVELPIDALETLLKFKKEILTEFNTDISTSNLTPDNLHEYWRNEVYAIRSAIYDGEKLLLFVGVKRNEYFFGMKEEAFLTLMKIYNEEKSK